MPQSPDTCCVFFFYRLRDLLLHIVELTTLQLTFMMSEYYTASCQCYAAGGFQLDFPSTVSRSKMGNQTIVFYIAPSPDVYCSLFQSCQRVFASIIAL